MTLEEPDPTPRDADEFQALSVIQPWRPMKSLPSECFPRWASLFCNRHAPEAHCHQLGIDFAQLPHAN